MTKLGHLSQGSHKNVTNCCDIFRTCHAHKSIADNQGGPRKGKQKTEEGRQRGTNGNQD